MNEPLDVKATHKALACKLLDNPDDHHALIAQMALLLDNGSPGNWPYVACLARRAWRNAPNDTLALFNHGSVLERTGRFREAAAVFKQCVDTNDPEWQELGLYHLGTAYRALGRNDKAIECYEKVIALAPDRLDYKKDLALALLAAGEFVRGLEVYEVRKQLAEAKLKRNKGELVGQHKTPPGPYWQGENLEGKSILVYHEDGIGDFIHFCRFIPMLRERGASRVFLTGPVPDLLDLVADNIPVDGIVPLDQPHACDYIVGSMSVPWRCRVQDINGRPYFRAEPAEFKRRSALEVGLVWHGNPAYPKDVFRSLPLTTFCPLFEIPGIAFYSLQKGDAAEQVHKLGFAGFIGDLAEHAQTWRDTASLIARLDAIVTVDTAVGHLAGALGVPVFILVTNACDWRWNRESMQTRWYDAARVLRQKIHGDWTPCVGLAKLYLEDMLHERRQVDARDRQGAASLRAAE